MFYGNLQYFKQKDFYIFGYDKEQILKSLFEIMLYISLCECVFESQRKGFDYYRA